MLDHPLFPLVSMNRLGQVVGYPKEDLVRIADHAARYYKSFEIRRLDAGPDKWRRIDTPKEQLKELQRRINRRLFAEIPFPSMMLGGVPGRSIQDNMNLHLKRPCLVTLDIRDCFPHTSNSRVHQSLRRELGCGRDTARTLTKLTTFHGRVPQGAPTSSAVTNLSLLPLYRDLAARIARKVSHSALGK